MSDYNKCRDFIQNAYKNNLWLTFGSENILSPLIKPRNIPEYCNPIILPKIFDELGLSTKPTLDNIVLNIISDTFLLQSYYTIYEHSFQIVNKKSIISDKN